jgi:hypothetical protein
VLSGVSVVHALTLTGHGEPKCSTEYPAIGRPARLRRGVNRKA